MRHVFDSQVAKIHHNAYEFVSVTPPPIPQCRPSSYLCNVSLVNLLCTLSLIPSPHVSAFSSFYVHCDVHDVCFLALPSFPVIQSLSNGSGGMAHAHQHPHRFLHPSSPIFIGGLWWSAVSQMELIRIVGVDAMHATGLPHDWLHPLHWPSWSAFLALSFYHLATTSSCLKTILKRR